MDTGFSYRSQFGDAAVFLKILKILKILVFITLIGNYFLYWSFLRNNILAKLFGNTERSIANWRQEKRPVIKLLEEVFTDEQIELFLANAVIPDLSNIKIESIYPILKRSLKVRIEEYRDFIGFQDTAYIKYLLLIWRAMIPQIRVNTSSDKSILSILNISIDNAVVKFPWGDMANFGTNKDEIKEKIFTFFEGLSESELKFVISYPHEFEEIIYLSFSKMELFSLKLPPSSI